MRKITLLIIIIMLLYGIRWAHSAAPVRSYSYTSGDTISSDEVTENEDAIFTYLQQGVEVYKDGTIVNADINSAANIAASKVNLTSVSQNITNTGNIANTGTLTNTGNVTITGNLSVSGTNNLSLEMSDLTDVNSSTQTAGNLLISNGVAFNSVAMAGVCTIDGAGTITCTDIEDTAYGAAWDGDLDAASKNVLYDKIAALESAGSVSLFTDGGTITYLTSTTDDLAVGGTTLTAAISIDASGKTVRAVGGFIVNDGDDDDNAIIKVDRASTDAAITWDETNDEFDFNFPANFGGTGQSQLTQGLLINAGQSSSDDDDTIIRTANENQFFVVDSGDDYLRIGDRDTNYMEFNITGQLSAVGNAGLSLTAISDIASATQTAGNILISNGVDFNSVDYYNEKCVTIENPVGTDDNVPIWSPNECIDVKNISCIVTGGNGLELQITDGTDAMDTIVCANHLTKDDGDIANSTFTADDVMEFNIGTTGGTNTWLNFCMKYQECF